MKNLKYNINKLILCLFVSILCVACDEGGELDPGNTATVEVAGEWVVEILRDGSPIDVNYISTYNTADNVATEIWLDDLQHGWGLKAKVPVDIGNLTFSGSGLEEIYYDVTVDITDGVIIKNGTTAPSGTVVDSIYFKAQFSDIPNETWEYAGYKRTGFLEDDLN
ncbi:lipid-binding protein [Winogradskyella schleiferi]|uniref:lipid-binding protein n=1 Tax=Winogradskyella schleiferi TaxID=2686078 RepID=UPI0015BD1E24|nr:lipid-binding protein [Winogradskyella schleiferi]